MTSSDASIDYPATQIDAASLDVAVEPPAGTLAEAGQKLSAAGQRLASAAMSPTGSSRPVAEIQEHGSADNELMASGIELSQNCVCSDKRSPFVFAIGTIGYDFGTEARKDSFRQLMPMTGNRPANPYATEQMITYLTAHRAEASKLIWTFNLESTPIYAIEPKLPPGA